jgi:60 kDa SS-A/Ro ribonucleoprotein
MTNYGDHYSKKKTPQDEPIPDKDMIENNAGGYAFKITPEQQFRRFLILGSEGGSYYVNERKLSIENAKNIENFIKQEGKKAVDIIIEVSQGGKAYKNDPALYALAIACSTEDKDIRNYALMAIPKVARIGTHLFHFLEFVESFRGWGRALRNAIADWYLTKDNDTLAYQVVKYQKRDGWSNRDALRLSHPKTDDGIKNQIFQWITQGKLSNEYADSNALNLIRAFEEGKTADSKRIIQLIEKYKLPREAIPTEYLSKPEVWRTLLKDIGLTALIRNLGNLSKIGLLSPANPDMMNHVRDRLTDDEGLKRSRIHPIQILAAMMTYSTGRGARGKGEWEVVPQVVDALDNAFYKTFDNVQPTGKRIALALDVSGSMTFDYIHGIPNLTPRKASTAMALVTANTEKDYTFLGFYDRINLLNISPRQRLDDVVLYINGLQFGATDCALPMIWALENKVQVDAFVIYTDSETWFGDIHPNQAIAEYRQKMDIPDAKLIVVGMVANRFSIADPEDPNMLDVVGFDTSTPQLISEFIRGDI